MRARRRRRRRRRRAIGGGGIGGVGGGGGDEALELGGGEALRRERALELRAADVELRREIVGADARRGAGPVVGGGGEGGLEGGEAGAEGEAEARPERILPARAARGHVGVEQL